MIYELSFLIHTNSLETQHFPGLWTCGSCHYSENSVKFPRCYKCEIPKEGEGKFKFVKLCSLRSIFTFFV